jgi:hypothetical protein
MWQLSNIQVSEGSVTEPVTLEEVKDWLQVDFTEHDGLLNGMIKGARRTIEKLCNISLVPKAVTLDVETTGDEKVPMPYTASFSGSPALVVKSFDSNDTETTLVSGTDFYVRGNNIRIGEGRYSVSYTTVPGTIPEDIKEAIKMEVAERYANRGENLTTSGLSKGAIEKVSPYQIIWL